MSQLLDDALCHDFKKLIVENAVCLPLEVLDTLPERFLQEGWNPKELRKPSTAMMIFGTTDSQGRDVYANVYAGTEECILVFIRVSTNFGTKTPLPIDAEELKYDSPFVAELLSMRTDC